MLAAAARDGETRERLSAFNAGIGVAGVAVHFNAWPWSLHRGVPMLDEAEGLSEEQLPAYNAVLWFWGSAASSASPEARPAARGASAIAGLLNFPILLVSARHHFRWAREQAELEPERWSPALLRMSDAGLAGGPRRALPQLRQPRRGGRNRARRRCRPTRQRRPPPDRDRGRCRDCSRQLDERGLARDLLRRGPERRALPRAAARDRRRGPRGRLPRLAPRAVGRPDARPSRPRTWPAASAAFGELGLEIAGLRPAGRPARRGRRSSVLREAGLRYCSPAGAGAGVEDGVALLPFELAPRRRQLRAAAARRRCASRSAARPTRSSPAPSSPTSEPRSAGCADDGGFIAIVLHPFMLGWLGEERLGSAARRGR